MSRATPFGISALSKSNRNGAYINEIMCDKNIGEMLVKTAKGDTISYSYFSRLKAMENSITTTALSHCKTGYIYSIIPDDVVLPYVIDNMTLATAHSYPGGSGVMVTLDIMGLIDNENQMSNNLIDSITANYTIIYTDMNNVTHTIHKEILVNNMIYDYIDLREPMKEISISDISLTVGTNSENYSLILNNILVFVSK